MRNFLSPFGRQWLIQGGVLVCVIVCFAFCSSPTSAVEVEHITKAGFSSAFVLVEISNRSDEIHRLLECNEFLKAPIDGHAVSEPK